MTLRLIPQARFSARLPTIAESGLPGYEVSAWFGLARARRHAKADAGYATS